MRRDVAKVCFASPIWAESAVPTRLPEVTLLPKHTILFLAANPLGTDRLALDREAQAIQVELERSGHGAEFQLVTRWAAQPLDLLRELRKLKPTIVHFSGHGNTSVATQLSNERVRRDVVGGSDPSHEASRKGLFFQAADGAAQLVSAAAIAQTFGAAGASVRVVVLNACYSAAQAAALLAHVGCVVGMRGSVCDDAARSFAVGLYGGLGEQESVAAAFRQGQAAINLEGLSDGDQPQLHVRDGIDAEKLVLISGPALARTASTVFATASNLKARVKRPKARSSLLFLLLLVACGGGLTLSVLTGWSIRNWIFAPATKQTEPFVIIIPDVQAVAMMTPLQPSPFALSINGRLVPLPKEGVLIGQPADIPEEIRADYRKLVDSGEPLRIRLSLTRQLMGSVTFTYEGRHCNGQTLIPTEKHIWVFYFESCQR